ncbi:MAG: hypothetical protein Q8P06_02315 [Candidatus Azambacteria bacterium]|nr:hypothetical protein [Candidatus Azambacteria bacterium]
MKRNAVIILGLVIFAFVGALIFYFYKTPKNNSDLAPFVDDFIQTSAQAPAVEGNIVNSGIAGKVVVSSGKAFEASLTVYKADDLNTPFISIRTHSDGTFQIPMRPGLYILKPMDPDGPIAPVRESYSFSIGNGQWLQVKIEYR